MKSTIAQVFLPLLADSKMLIEVSEGHSVAACLLTFCLPTDPQRNGCSDEHPRLPLGAGGRNGSVRDFIPHAESVKTKSFRNVRSVSLRG